MYPIVQRIKEYYLANPHYQYFTEDNWVYIIDSVRARRETRWLKRAGKDPTPLIKPLPAPVTVVEIVEAEKLLGFKIPPLLRELYLEIGNGGFRPHILGLNKEGWREGISYAASSVEHYLLEYREGEESLGQEWNEFLKERLVIGYGGCTLYYLLDCRSEDGPIICWDARGLTIEAFEVKAYSLTNWLENWLDGSPGYEQ